MGMWSLCRNVFLALLLIWSPGLQAQQSSIHTIGTTIDVVGGSSNNSNALGSAGSKSIAPFYGIFPTVNVNMAGGRSSFNLSYAYGLNRATGEDHPNSETHQAHLNYSRL